MNATNTIIRNGPDIYQNSIEKYIEIIEKTNVQLGWWLNISNYMITLLGVIVAVIAVFVTFVFWKSSREQRERFEEFLKSQEKLFTEKTKEFEEENKRRREESKVALEELINEQQEKLKSSENNNKNEIQKVIDDLKKQKATIGLQINNDLIFKPFQSSTGNEFYTTLAGTGATNNIWGRTGGTINPIGTGTYLSSFICSKCNSTKITNGNYCPNCGNKF